MRGPLPATRSGLVSAVLGAGLCLITCGAALADAPIDVRLDRTRIERFAAVEMTFPDRWSAANPYDDRQIAVEAEVTTPGGRRFLLPGFFCQEFEERLLPAAGSRDGRGGTIWQYPVGRGVWKVRFAPMEVGRHSCTIAVRTVGRTARSAPIEFECVPSKRKGFLRVSKHDPRYLELTDGASFFPIGQNVAFIGLLQHVGSLEKATEVFRRIGENGGNYVRIWAGCDDWAMGIEARKSCWGRSWSWNPPFAPMPDAGGDTADRMCIRLGDRDGAALTADPTRPIPVRPATRYTLTGHLRAEANAASVLVRVDGRVGDLSAAAGERAWKPFRLEFTTGERQWFIRSVQFRVQGNATVYLADLSLRESARPPTASPPSPPRGEGGGEGDGADLLAFEADPNRPQLGWYDQRDCRLLDGLLAAAQEHGVYVQLCLLKRDLYMSRLSDEQSPAYDAAIADARRTFRYAVARWGAFESLGAWEYWNEMDPGKPTARFFRELAAYLDRIDPYRHLRTTSDWGPTPRDWNHPQLDLADLHYYIRPSTGDLFKDAVASAARQAALLRASSPVKPLILGEFGLADDQWGRSPFMEQDRDLLHLHDALWASVFSGASSTALFWWWETLDKMNAYRHYRPLAAFLVDVPFTEAGFQPAAWETSAPRLRVMALRGKSLTCLWVSDPASTWHRAVVEKVAPAEVKGAVVDLPDVPAGRYRVQWWDAYQGRVIRQDEVAADPGRLRLTLPPFTRDLAAKVCAIGGSTTMTTRPLVGDWRLVWSDEFDYEGLPDPAKWDYEEGFVRNNEMQYYTRARRENARVDNGTLIIEGRKERLTNPKYDPVSKNWQRSRQFADYTSASLITLNKAGWRYGRIKVRAKLPQGNGVWPAIWTLGTNIRQVGWPRCGEIGHGSSVPGKGVGDLGGRVPDPFFRPPVVPVAGF